MPAPAPPPPARRDPAAPPAAEEVGLPALAGTPGAAPGLAPSVDGAITAKLLAPAVAYRDEALTRRAGVVSERTRYTRSGTRLLVLGGRYGDDGRLRLKVVVPLRPTGRPAWITTDAVRLTRSHWYISVDRATRTARIYEDGKPVQAFRVVIGAAATPTPGGMAALYEKVPANDPTIFTGPWSLHLTAFSRVLDRFGAGDGRIAMHGRGPASWSDPLGTARSHGCIRVDNYWSRWIARNVPLGTPVAIE